jgi:hypothetical protein
LNYLLIDFARIDRDRSRMHLQQTHNSKPKLEVPQREVRNSKGVAQDKCTTQEETKQGKKSTNGHKCTILKKIQLERKSPRALVLNF